MPTPPSNERSVRKRRIPQQARSRERVERILDAAATLVAEKGVDALSTRGIAEAAGIPVASLYQYFADRDDILLALVERDIAAMDEQVMADVGALERPTIPGIVAATMGAFVKVYLRRPAFVVIWLRGRTNQAIKDYGREHNRRVARDLYEYAVGLGLLVEQAQPLYAELAVEIGDRLFQLAFETQDQGDPLILDEAVKMVTNYLRLYATPAGLED